MMLIILLVKRPLETLAAPKDQVSGLRVSCQFKIVTDMQASFDRGVEHWRPMNFTAFFFFTCYHVAGESLSL